MNGNATENGGMPAIISLSKWLRDMGRSDTTGWRWCRAGWLHPINIAGRPYLTREDIQRFQTRATAGEFFKAPAGAARRSAETRAAQQASVEPAKAKEVGLSGTTRISGAKTTGPEQ
jgi:hypothetical protein